MSDHKILAENANGVQLVKDCLGVSIIKPNANGTNRVFHVGKEGYVRSVWRKQYENAQKYISPFAAK